MADHSTTEKSLYARLGGYDVIAAFVDEFSQTFVSDPRAARFLVMNLERQKRNRQLTVDYLCAAAGGPVLYLGQDMKTAHMGLGISTGEWDIAMEYPRCTRETQDPGAGRSGATGFVLQVQRRSNRTPLKSSWETTLDLFRFIG
jgi:hemoglobin